MQLFTSSPLALDGVVERELRVGDVPGVLWSPATASHPGPLLLLGHGGGLHKRAPGLVARARHHVITLGCHAVAIDAPGHGDRPRNAEDHGRVAAMLAARADGRPIAAAVDAYNSSVAERAVPEWRATLDALLTLPEISDDAPVGYSGMTLATAIGLPPLVAEPRVRAAVLGGVFASASVLEAAREVSVPVQLLVSWDDTELDRGSSLALFDALGAQPKTMHVVTGGHHEVPWSETEDSTAFFARHLGRGSVGP